MRAERGGQDRANPELNDHTGVIRPFNELAAAAGGKFAPRCTLEAWQDDWRRCWRGCARTSSGSPVELPDWERMFRVNKTGPLLGIQALVPLIPPGSSVVTIGSAAALTPHYTVAYTASK